MLNGKCAPLVRMTLVFESQTEEKQTGGLFNVQGSQR